MANIELILEEKDLVEEDGKVYRVSENGIKNEVAWSTIFKDFQRTDKQRAENIVALRRDKYFNKTGIDIDDFLKVYLNQENGVIKKDLNEIILEEFNNLEVEIDSFTTNDTTFERKIDIKIK